MGPDCAGGRRRWNVFRWIVPVVLGLALAGLSGCVTGDVISPADAEWPNPAASDGRVLIRRAALTMQVEDPARAAREAEEITAAFGGHVASSTVHGDRLARLTLRVTQERLDETLDALAGLGRVRERRISSEDVTGQVIDLDARRRNLAVTRDRLREHLAAAATVEDILAVERELARVQGELESLEGRLAHLRASASLSTVELTLERRTVLGPLGWAGRGALWMLSKLFVIR